MKNQKFRLPEQNANYEGSTSVYFYTQVCCFFIALISLARSTGCWKLIYLTFAIFNTRNKQEGAGDRHLISSAGEKAGLRRRTESSKNTTPKRAKLLWTHGHCSKELQPLLCSMMKVCQTFSPADIRSITDVLGCHILSYGWCGFQRCQERGERLACCGCHRCQGCTELGNKATEPTNQSAQR